MSDPYLGEIRMTAFNFAPVGWAMCQGQTVAISQNQALFALLGTNFGGNGVSNFMLPNLQGRSPVGWGSGLGLAPIQIGEQAGVENVTITTANMPAHTHVATVTGGVSVSGQVSIPANSAAAETSVPGPTTVLSNPSAGGRGTSIYTAASSNTTLAPFNVTLTGGAPTIQNALTGGTQPMAIRNPYLGVTFMIALSGVFPSRS
ncbi:MAG TPA: tail fiber protein [Paraburkholderia sp.]|jgi:microcystin-dependent protein|nr:tail fiber protein [Paraburkholderia sp.]